MGAEPRVALLSLVLPAHLPCCDFDAMIEGIATLAGRHHVHLIGGNLTQSPGPLVLDVTVTGSVKRRRVLTRAGARVGDALYVTGSLGAAAAGLQMLRTRTRDSTEATAGNPALSESCVRRYLYPEPRVRTGMLLSRNRAATACMDLSDGLADAVSQVTAASGVGASIDADALPVDRDARDWFVARGADAVSESIAGGDDYELLFAARPRSTRMLDAIARQSGVALTKIGVCTAETAVTLRDAKGEKPMPRGYKHFA